MRFKNLKGGGGIFTLPTPLISFFKGFDKEMGA